MKTINKKIYHPNLIYFNFNCIPLYHTICICHAVIYIYISIDKVNGS